MSVTRSVRRLGRVCAVGALIALLGVAGAAASDGASQVRDIAGMFDLDTLRKARAALDRIDAEHHVLVLIETIDSLNGEPINDVATRRYREAGNKGIYILIAKESRRISNVLVPDPLAGRLSEDRRSAIRDAFIAGFKKADFDAGLESGVAAIEKSLSEIRARSGASASAAYVSVPLNSSLVVRNQVRLTLAGARTIITAAETKAADMKVKINIAVVDDGGHLLAFARMDGARPASGYTAITKATSAATLREATGPLPAGAATPDILLNISLQNAAAVSGGKFSTLLGGVPIVVDGQVIGGVGVGGGTGAQDAEVARSGIAKLLDELKPKEEE